MTYTHEAREEDPIASIPPSHIPPSAVLDGLMDDRARSVPAPAPALLPFFLPSSSLRRGPEAAADRGSESPLYPDDDR